MAKKPGNTLSVKKVRSDVPRKRQHLTPETPSAELPLHLKSREPVATAKDNLVLINAKETSALIDATPIKKEYAAPTLSSVMPPKAFTYPEIHSIGMHPTVVENHFLRVGFHSGHEVGVLARVGGHPHSENEPLVFFLEFLTKVPFKMDATALTYMRWFIGCEPGPADMVAHQFGAFFGRQPSKMDHKARIAHAYRLRTGGSPTVFDMEVDGFIPHINATTPHQAFEERFKAGFLGMLSYVYGVKPTDEEVAEISKSFDGTASQTYWQRVINVSYGAHDEADL